MKIYKDKIDDFFKGQSTELVELDDIDVSEDPVRPGCLVFVLQMVVKYLV